MCGICGIVDVERGGIEQSTIRRMADVLHHRGPDDSGVWISPSAGPTVGLGHRRLSIIDLSKAGRQPMTNEDSTVWLTYNGEIYNHALVRRDLETAGHRYASHTDSETIIHAYEEWGDDCVTRFRGMFAFGLWDMRRRRLLLVRDRLGVKPLYYAQSGSALIFASEIKSILESGHVPVKPALDRIPEYLSFGYLAGEETLFEGVRKLPPGSLLVWEDGRTTIRSYWDVRFEPNEARSEEEEIRRFKELFERSVEMRLMSDVPLGVFLSGGLDSSAIAAVAAKFVNTPLKTFSVGYPAPYYSEVSYARQVAKLIGADHHETVLTADAFFNALPRLTWHEDEPLWGSASVALYFVSELAASEVKVVLTGEGSDELFGGYDRYGMTAVNARCLPAWNAMPGPLKRAARAMLLNGPLPERVRRALGHTILKHDRLPDSLFLDNWFGIFSLAAQEQLAGTALRHQVRTADVHDAHRRLYEACKSSDVIDRMLYTDIKTNLVELLMKQDQMSMATSIESRVPFLDHVLVEFAATVPSRRKIKGLSGKQVVKKALAEYLPASIRHRRKMGFPVPYDSWLNERFGTGIESLLLEDRTQDRGWVDGGAIRDIFARHRGGRENLARQIWALWGLELWARIFFEGERPDRTGAAAEISVAVHA